ncbi:hypothetical protein B0H16DRAFT_1482814 [Mycena metata]|uniref:Uncharacterized protein n=1 Tax=Mycena metata TaxID=1033252 RepID=A0AAD7M6M1_9AGAR|nr:hypothetical protein B0H16DRAFT_1482814 [Mycena metata]
MATLGRIRRPLQAHTSFFCSPHPIQNRLASFDTGRPQPPHTIVTIFHKYVSTNPNTIHSNPIQSNPTYAAASHSVAPTPKYSTSAVEIDLDFDCVNEFLLWNRTKFPGSFKVDQINVDLTIIQTPTILRSITTGMQSRTSALPRVYFLLLTGPRRYVPALSQTYIGRLLPSFISTPNLWEVVLAEQEFSSDGHVWDVELTRIRCCDFTPSYLMSKGASGIVIGYHELCGERRVHGRESLSRADFLAASVAPVHRMTMNGPIVFSAAFRARTLSPLLPIHLSRGVQYSSSSRLVARIAVSNWDVLGFPPFAGFLRQIISRAGMQIPRIQFVFLSALLNFSYARLVQQNVKYINGKSSTQSSQYMPVLILPREKRTHDLIALIDPHSTRLPGMSALVSCGKIRQISSRGL